MKKKIFLFILLAIMITSLFSQKSSSETFVKKAAVENFNRLIIKSNITVMLIEDPSEDSIRIEGSKKFIEKVLIIQAGKELTVRSKSFKDQKKKGIIYPCSVITKYGNRCRRKSYFLQCSAIAGFKHSYQW
jgi:hypothetical protein